MQYRREKEKAEDVFELTKELAKLRRKSCEETSCQKKVKEDHKRWEGQVLLYVYKEKYLIHTQLSPRSKPEIPWSLKFKISLSA